MYNYENNNDEAKKEEALNEGEFQMVRSRYEQLDEDRSTIPPPNQKEESKLLKLIKKNKLVFAVILTLFVALTLSIILLCIYSANSSDKALTGDYTFVFGTEEIKYKNSRVVIDGVLYVDMNRLAAYASLSSSGSHNTMKYIASEGQYIKFTNESEYAVINGTKVVLDAPAYVDEAKCIVPYSVISKAVTSGIVFRLDEKNTVTIKRRSYEDKENNVIIYQDITFSPDAFRTAGAISDVSAVTFDYPIDVSAYLSAIAPENKTAYLLLVNEQNPLSQSYVPNELQKLSSDITALGESYFLEKDAAIALEAMMKTLKAYGVYVTSAYRDYEYQVKIFEQYVKVYTDMGYSREDAVAEVRRTSAYPGTSEHQSGLCVDFMSDGQSTLDNGFEDTTGFKWLGENAYKYGFILRYPKDKTDFTSYDYESWHYRYVGRAAATEIYFSGLSLEEYLELI